VLDNCPPWVRLGLLVLFAVNTADAAAAAGPSACPPGATDATAVVCELNAARADVGRGPLASTPSLGRAATAHATDMVERHFFAHDSPGGGTPVTRVRRAGYLRGIERWSIGEVLMWSRGQPLTAAAAVAAWLASRDHRPILLRRRYEDVGVGIAPGAPLGDPAIQPATTIAVSFGRRSG
jgi:uncharacterized protein YkwD